MLIKDWLMDHCDVIITRNIKRGHMQAFAMLLICSAGGGGGGVDTEIPVSKKPAPEKSGAAHVVVAVCCPVKPQVRLLGPA